MTWQVIGRTTGWRSHAALCVIVPACLAWLAWPLLSSATVASVNEFSAELPYLVAAVLGMSVLLAVLLWLDVGRRLGNLAAIPVFVVSGVLIRLLLSPGMNGIEPIWWVPLVAGMTLGSPAGWLVGVVMLTLSAVATDTVSGPIVTQLIVMGCWGVVGGWFRGFGHKIAWLLALMSILPLGVATGVALNITGWAQNISAQATSFIPGLKPAEIWRRLWLYTTQTSFVYDSVRTVTNFVIVALIGPWGIKAVRGVAWIPSSTRIYPTTARATISQRARQRRERSDTLSTLWTKKEDSNDESDR